MQIANKITIGGINSVRKGFKDVKEKTHVARIIGIAREASLKTSENMADSWKFSGEFRAWNREGEEVAAPTCYMPDPAQGLLKAAVDADKSGAGVQFGFDFYVVPDENVAIGYHYEIKPLMESKPSDALAALSKSAAPLPQLGHKAGDDVEQPAPDGHKKNGGSAKK